MIENISQFISHYTPEVTPKDFSPYQPDTVCKNPGPVEEPPVIDYVKLFYSQYETFEVKRYLTDHVDRNQLCAQILKSPDVHHYCYKESKRIGWYCRYCGHKAPYFGYCGDDCRVAHNKMHGDNLRVQLRKFIYLKKKGYNPTV